MPEKILRGIFILLFTVLGIVLSRQETVLAMTLPKSVLTETILGVTFMSLGAMLIGGILGAIVGCFISPYLNRSLFAFTSRVEKSLSSMSVQDLVAGTLGLFLGLIIANLVGLAFISVPYIGPYVSVALSIVLGYLGMHLAVSKKSEMASWFHFHSEPDRKKNKDKRGRKTAGYEYHHRRQGGGYLPHRFPGGAYLCACIRTGRAAEDCGLFGCAEKETAAAGALIF